MAITGPETSATRSRFPDHPDTVLSWYRFAAVLQVHGQLKEAEATPLSQEEQEALKRFRRPTEEEIRDKAGPAGQAQGTAGVPF